MKNVLLGELNTCQNLQVSLRTNFYLFVRKVFDELHRASGNPFVEGWHIEAMCFQMQRLYDGDIRRLLISVPPRYLKSIMAAVAYPAWVLGHDPSRRIMVATYGAELAEKHSRDFRKIIESPWYGEVFPEFRINPRVNRALEVETSAGGGRKAVSVQGPHTGFGATDLVIDDLMKATDVGSEAVRGAVKDFYASLTTRFDEKRTGRIVSIQQRLHEDDLPAHLINLGGYEQLELKAIADEDETHQLYLGREEHRRPGDALFPDREPLDVLKDIKRDLGSQVFSAQYQQNPVSPDGNIVQVEWLHMAKVSPDDMQFDRIVQSWDTAITDEPTSDYSVCITAGYWDGHWYVIDVWRGRLKHPALRKFIAKHAIDKRADKVLIELANTGHALLTELRDEFGAKFIGIRPRGSKESRLIGQTGKLESGLVMFANDSKWWNDLRKELIAFPYGRYDDQVDALSQLLAWLDTAQARGLLNRDPVTNRLRRQRNRRGGRRLARLRPSNSSFAGLQ